MKGGITGDTIGVVATTRTYDDHGDLRGIELRVAGARVSTTSVDRDSLGRIVVQRDSSAAIVATTGYRYDALDRLDRVTTNGVPTQQFEYDLAGNRVAVTSAAGRVAASYAADDRMLAFDGQAIEHDSSGSRTKELRGSDTLSYAYDDVGRLVAATSAISGALTFKLDAIGRRVQELRNGTVVRGFLYGVGTGPIAQLTPAGGITSEFVYVSGDVAPDYLIQNGKSYYLQHDQLGSVRQVIDAGTGVVVQEIDYDVWGQITRNTNPGFQPFGYAGGLVDVAERTAHFGARDYDARTGRWLQADPSGIGGGRNRFVYATNSPSTQVDLFGFDVCLESTNNPNVPFGLHQRVAVYSKAGQFIYGQSFGTNNPQAGLFTSERGSSGSRAAPSFTGEVYDNTSDKTRGKIKCFPSTDDQNDRVILPALKGELGKNGPYSATNIGGTSCRGYSQKTYDRIKKLLGL